MSPYNKCVNFALILLPPYYLTLGRLLSALGLGLWIRYCVLLPRFMLRHPVGIWDCSLVSTSPVMDTLSQHVVYMLVPHVSCPSCVCRAQPNAIHRILVLGSLANFNTNASRLATAHQSSSLRPLVSGTAIRRFALLGDRTQSPRLRRSPHRRPAGGSQARIEALTVRRHHSPCPMDAIYDSCARMALRWSAVRDPERG